MLFGQFEDSLIKRKTKIDFDKKKKIFRLAMPISSVSLSSSVLGYVQKRKHLLFKPHQTSFQIDPSNQIELVQEIPFQGKFQPTLRVQLIEFWRLGKRCHQMFQDMAKEENLEYLKSLFTIL